MLGLTTREPVGVAALITAWNFPFVILSQKLPFALAAGCTVVVKPSELTPGSALRLGAILNEAGVPEGVVNIIVGYGATVGQRLAEHPNVDMISFTGSTAVGKGIVRAAAGNLKRVALELGGNNPQIVCADADLDVAADAVVFGVFFKAGQCCNSSSRLIVEKSISEDFLAPVEALTARVTVGDPMDEVTKVGAIVNQNQMDWIIGFVDVTSRDGATVRTGGTRMSTGKGLFMTPTVVSEVTRGMSIATDEVFGPVLSTLTFEDIDDAISIANSTHYALSAGIWTNRHETALKASRELSAGTVWVNCWMDGFPEIPFGGMRESGIGREQGPHAIEDYSHTRLTLLEHPLSFLRRDLSERRIVTCQEAMSARDGRWLMTAGLVLVRQKPRSAKGVMFITIEDETGPANVVVWPKLFERRRRVVLGSSMIAIKGRIQREGEVVHLIPQQLFDLSVDLSTLSDRDADFRLPDGRGDGLAHGGGPDPRDRQAPAARPRDMFVRDLHIDTLKVKAWNFH